MVSGEGSLVIEGKAHSIASCQSALIPPGVNAEFEIAGQSSSWYQIRFCIYSSIHKGNSNGLLSMQEGRQEYLPMNIYGESCFPVFSSLARRLCQIKADGGDTASYWQAQSLMAQIVEALIKYRTSEISPDPSGIERTASYMERNYSLPISRDSLAKMANMSLSYYAHQFKRIYGVAPMDYLNEVRMRRAKLLLTRDRLTVQEAANQTGFEDAFYFSRKFKKHFGMSPSVFIRKHTPRFASLNYLFGGDMMALGLPHEGAVADVEREWQCLRVGSCNNMLPMRSMRLNPDIVSSNMRHLAQSRPDIIFCTPYELKFYDYKLLQRIAPTIVIPWSDMTWQEHLQCLAEYTGRRHEAEKWLERYQSNVEQVRSSIRNRIGGGTLSVFHILRGQLVAYGDRNGGSVLFRDLKIKPAYDLDAIEVYKVLDIPDIKQYAGDFVLLSVDPDESSSALSQKLLTSSVWKQLDAVRWGQSFILQEQPWIDYCAPAHADILQRSLHMFRS